MKKQKILLSCLLGVCGCFTYSQVGINTATPSAALDIVSQGNTSATKALEINNSSALEMLTVQNDGNVGLNSPTVANNTAQLNINSGSASKSVLKINNISNSKDKTVSAINYNRFSNLVSDTNGNVFLQYDIKTTGTNAITFDGTYNAGTSFNNMLALNIAGIVQFQLITDLVLGDTANGGSVLYADITWSRDKGFQVSSHGSSSNTSNTMNITGIGTHTLTFDFGTGRDFILNSTLTGSTTSGDMQYRVTSGSNVPFNIFNSFRSR